MADLNNTSINGVAKIPVGTTLQRPLSPSSGYVRFNTDFKEIEFYDGMKWVSSDGANPIVKDGLQLYLDASDSDSYPGSGTSWFDLSGNNRTCTWISTPTFQNFGVRNFTVLGNSCRGPASNSFGITNTSGYTITTVFKQNSLVSTGAFQFYQTGVSNSRAIFAHCTWSDNIVYFDQGGCCASDTRTYAHSQGVEAWTVMTFRRQTNGSTRTIFKNSSILAEETATAATVVPNSTPVDVAGSAVYGGNTSTWDANIAAFLVYNRGLTDAEVKSNVATIRARLGI